MQNNQSTLMTSDQQSHFECAIAQTDYSNVEKTFDNIADIGLENETVCGSETSQCVKENGQSLSECQKVSENEENVNFGPSGAEDENHFAGIPNLDEKLQVNGDAVSGLNIGDQEGVSDREQPINSHSPNETVPQTLSLDQSNQQGNDTSCDEQPQNPCAEIKDIQQVIQQEATNLIENADLPNLTPGTTNPIAESIAVIASPVADEEIENNAEASNDENETSSEEQESNEDSSEFPDIVDFDATNEAENDEYILDTVVRKRSKARRRIVSVNDDDSDPEIEIERKRLLQSPTVEENELTDIDGVEEDIELLIQNEKPGPKSKKMSTQKLKELQTRELLRNAVVIPSGKKRKGRIIDTDDEDDSVLPYCVNVDDIGLPDVTDDNDNDNETDALVGNSILLNDIDKPESSSVENLIHPRDASTEIEVSPDVNSLHEMTFKEETKHDNSSEGPENIESLSENLQEIQKPPSEVVPELVKLESSDATKNEPTFLCDSGNSTDSTNQQCGKGNGFQTATKAFPSFSASSSSDGEDEFIPNDVYFGTPDINKRRYVHIFPSQHPVIYECYSSSRGKGGRPRGRPSQLSSRQPTTATKGSGSSRRAQPPRREKFIDNGRYVQPMELKSRRSFAFIFRASSTSASMSTSSSSESDDEFQKSKARRKPQTITIVKHPTQLYHKASLPIRPVQAIQKQQQIQRQNRRKRDRFYDKSQDIPNSIYFGDVDVPLHVLHAYGGSDSDNETGINSKVGAAKFDPSKGNKVRFSSQVSRGRGRTMANPLGQLHSEVRYQNTTSPGNRIISDNRKARGRPKVNSVSPSNDRSIQMMRKFLKAAGLKKVKLNRLWEGEKSFTE